MFYNVNTTGLTSCRLSITVKGRKFGKQPPELRWAFTPYLWFMGQYLVCICVFVLNFSQIEPTSLHRPFSSENVLHVRGERLQLLSCVSTSKRWQEHAVAGHIAQPSKHRVQQTKQWTLKKSEVCTAKRIRQLTEREAGRDTIRHTLPDYYIPTQYVQAGLFSRTCADTCDTEQALLVQTGNVPATYLSRTLCTNLDATAPDLNWQHWTKVHKYKRMLHNGYL